LELFERDLVLLRERDFVLLLVRDPALRVAMRAFVSNDRAYVPPGDAKNVLCCAKPHCTRIHAC
jgi:hypothetical protein